MLRTRWMVLFRLALALLLPAVAGAEEEPAKDREGPYLGGAFALGLEQFDGTEAFDDFDEGFGFDAWFGYRLNDLVAVELQVIYLKGFDSEIGSRDVDFRFVGATGNLKVYPFTGPFEPFVVVGIGGAEVEARAGSRNTDESDNIFITGAGFDVYVMEDTVLVAGVEYIHTEGDLNGSDVLQIRFGVQYNF